MRFGVRTANPPDSGESAAADLEKQWNVPNPRWPATRTAEWGRLDVPSLVSEQRPP